MFFVSNLQSSSQAGRRRFEPGLPLHVFNQLAHFQLFLSYLVYLENPEYPQN